MWTDVVDNNLSPKPPKEILEYYFSTRGDEGTALRELRLIVVGRGRAGKTSLIRRLNNKPLNLAESETHGVNVSNLQLPCGDGPIVAHAWDFGGQHVLHAMHEFFLSARCLYLVVLNQRDDSASRDAAYWLQVIRTHAPNAPVVVAVNQSRGVMRPLNMDEFENNYGPINAWVATECLDETECSGAGATIEVLRKALIRTADAMSEPRKLFPRKWVNIKTWLEGMREPYLAYETFVNECVKLQERDPAKQRELAALMHELGTALNYARDPRLRDTTVLRPDWLANGIDAILRANLLTKEPLIPDGVLSIGNLGEIYRAAETAQMLNASEYPEEKWLYLLRLMGLFQLSFPLDEHAQRQLVPALLPVDVPAGTDEPAGVEVFKMRFEFGVRPAPLFGRFLVEVFPLIEGRKSWQRGALLRYGGARARVWADENERYLFITAGGEAHDRDELVEMARQSLKRIFRGYGKLNVTEQWLHDEHWVPRATLEKFGVLGRETSDESMTLARRDANDRREIE